MRSEAGVRIPRDCEDEIALREWGKCVIQTVCDLLYGIVWGKRDYRVAIGLSHCKMKVNSILTAAKRPASERNVQNTIGVLHLHGYAEIALQATHEDVLQLTITLWLSDATKKDDSVIMIVPEDFPSPLWVSCPERCTPVAPPIITETPPIALWPPYCMCGPTSSECSRSPRVDAQLLFFPHSGHTSRCRRAFIVHGWKHIEPPSPLCVRRVCFHLLSISYYVRSLHHKTSSRQTQHAGRGAASRAVAS